MEKVLNNNNKKQVEILFVIISIVFGLLFIFSKIAADDLACYTSMGKTLSQNWGWTVQQYNTWSSRMIINFIWAVVTTHGKLSWMIYMMISMYILLKGLYLISFEEYNLHNGLFVCAIAMLFPMINLCSAGWIATTTSYFGPMACGVMAIVPFKKFLNGNKLPLKSFILYIFALIYAANAEQMCVALLFTYFVMSFLLLKGKKFNWQALVMLIITIASFVFMMTCPGNWSRKTLETMNWFPTFGMLDTIDKLDIGVSTTLKWMFASGNIFIIAICFLIALFVFKRYNDILYRMIAIFPFMLTLILGPFLHITSNLFPHIALLSSEINYYGAFNVASSGVGIGMIQFGTFLLVCLFIVISIFLLNEDVSELVFDLTIIAAGFGSRLMMCFSPTVYASSNRTYNTLVVCLFIIGTQIYSKNCRFLSKDNKNMFMYAEIMIILIGLIKLYRLTSSYFY